MKKCCYLVSRQFWHYKDKDSACLQFWPCNDTHVPYRILWVTEIQLYFVSRAHMAMCAFYLHLITGIDKTGVVKQLKLIKVIHKTDLYGAVTVILQTKCFLQC